jgi:hypothetical protein
MTTQRGRRPRAGVNFRPALTVETFIGWTVCPRSEYQAGGVTATTRRRDDATESSLVLGSLILWSFVVSVPIAVAKPGCCLRRGRFTAALKYLQ